MCETKISITINYSTISRGISIFCACLSGEIAISYPKLPQEWFASERAIEFLKLEVRLYSHKAREEWAAEAVSYLLSLQEWKPSCMFPIQCSHIHYFSKSRLHQDFPSTRYGSFPRPVNAPEEPWGWLMLRKNQVKRFILVVHVNPSVCIIFSSWGCGGH